MGEESEVENDTGFYLSFSSSLVVLIFLIFLINFKIKTLKEEFNELFDINVMDMQTVLINFRSFKSFIELVITHE